MTESKAASKAKASGAAARSKAALAEQNGHREMDFEGLTIELPSKLPSSFSYRFAKISRLEDLGENAAGDVYALMVQVIGEKQFDAVSEHVDSIEDDIGLADFLARVIVEYGNEPGESSASPKS